MRSSSKCIMIILSLLIITSSVSSTQASVSDTLNELTILRVRQGEITVSSSSIKGNTTDSRLELLINSMSFNRENLLLRSTLETSVNVNGSTIAIDGPLNGTKLTVNRASRTVLQMQEYIEGLPVGQRVRSNRTEPTRVIEFFSVNINESREIRYSYQDLIANENFSSEVNSELGITAFIGRSGSFRSVLVNNSDGEVIGRVFGFKIRLSVFFFETLTENFLGLHYTDDSGFGNNLPIAARERLNQGPYEDRTTLRERNQIRDRHVNWISLGFNETLGLDMYHSFFTLSRSSYRVLINTRTIPSSGLSVTALDGDALEGYADDLIALNELPGFDEESYDATESEIVDNIVEDDGLVLPETSVTSSTSSSVTSNTDSSNQITPISTNDASYPFLGLFILLSVPFVRKIRSRN